SPAHSDAGRLAGVSAAEGLSARGTGRAVDGESARLAQAAPGQGTGGYRVGVVLSSWYLLLRASRVLCPWSEDQNAPRTDHGPRTDQEQRPKNQGLTASDGNTSSSSRRDVRHQRARDQHGAAASEHARRAAGGAAARRRE